MEQGQFLIEVLSTLISQSSFCCGVKTNKRGWRVMCAAEGVVGRRVGGGGGGSLL